VALAAVAELRHRAFVLRMATWKWDLLRLSDSPAGGVP
jgi:hypothetical protein